MSDRSEQTALLEGPRRNYKELSNKELSFTTVKNANLFCLKVWR